MVDRIDDGGSQREKPPGWEKVVRLQMEAKDIALQMKPHIREAKKYATVLASRLSVGYFEVRKDPILEPAFDKAVRQKKGGKDLFRAYVYWAIYDDLADEWEALKGIIDQVVAALHVMNRDYLFKPGVIISTDAVQYQIEHTTFGKDRTGLSACWSQWMAMQQAAAEETRQELLEKDRVYARHLEAEARKKQRSEAAAEGISVEEYERRQEAERIERAEATKRQLVSIIEAQLAKSGRPVDMAKDPLRHGLYFFDETEDRLFRISDDERDEMYRCKMALLTEAH